MSESQWRIRPKTEVVLLPKIILRGLRSRKIPWLDVVCPHCRPTFPSCDRCRPLHEQRVWAYSNPERIAIAQEAFSGDCMVGKLLADWYRDNVQGLIEE